MVQDGFLEMNLETYHKTYFLKHGKNQGIIMVFSQVGLIILSRIF